MPRRGNETILGWIDVRVKIARLGGLTVTRQVWSANARWCGQPIYFAAFLVFARPAALIFRLPGLTGRICFAGPAPFKKPFARCIL
jgi:hypothetical protein